MIKECNFYVNVKVVKTAYERERERDRQTKVLGYRLIQEAVARGGGGGERLGMKGSLFCKRNRIESC